MADDPNVDTNAFPEGVDIPSTLSAQQAAGDADAALQLIQFLFCLRFAGRAWTTVPVTAPSPEDAATTMDQFVRQVLNPQLARMGYPNNVCSWSSGACE